ncbi:hypothetical protein ABIF38_003587 [Bradyrhizobium japonicum]|uniref:Uncharacterized protein n=1 Tax=Bradyrhizobium elkanii TaxID=29448 RepID=A0ABV4F9S1_BRAEL|nr:hypothetical protein [Bradyrhizobium elkanii]MCP1734100.1 hypothetical protein [Bradyrhizobium elkanii]MCP1751783.1 hypothetical protein [Bradyrhizobium elkanii]MCP1977554.1 hypothetical protein [Bradyrhizobium elkanii]MCS3569437.1 hypothetical protein [Bradyrhizobium elkanii]
MEAVQAEAVRAVERVRVPAQAAQAVPEAVRVPAVAVVTLRPRLAVKVPQVAPDTGTRGRP